MLWLRFEFLVISIRLSEIFESFLRWVFLSIRKLLSLFGVKDSGNQEFWLDAVQNHCKLCFFYSTIVTIRWDMFANEPKCHIAQFKTMKKQVPIFKYTKAKYWKWFWFLCFHIVGLEKEKKKKRENIICQGVYLFLFCDCITFSTTPRNLNTFFSHNFKLKLLTQNEK